MSEQKQKTPAGVEIPIPKRADFMKNLNTLVDPGKDEKPSLPKRSTKK